MSSWLSFLASRGARLGAGGVADFGDAAAELTAARGGTIVADLSHEALIAVTGEEASAFLHAQLTNDVQTLPKGAAQWPGWCTPKGRLLATILLVRRAEGYLLILPAEIAAAIAKRLAMFVLRSKVRIEEESAGVMIARHWAHTPDPLRSVEKDNALCIALDEQRFMIVTPHAAAPILWDALSEHAVKAGADAWEWAAIRAGIPTIVAATQEAFVPQMANFDLIGGVSFRKGCYPGQEVVARTQYRGILKRRMALAHLDGTERPAPAQSVYSAAFGEQAAGMIVNAAPSPEGGFDLLVVAQLESLARADLRWKSPQGPRLEIRERPPIGAKALT